MKNKQPNLHFDFHVLSRARLSNSKTLAQELQSIEAEKARAAERRLAAPQARAFDAPPTSNTGGKIFSNSDVGQEKEFIQLQIENGELKEVPKRILVDGSSMHDWVGISFHESTLESFPNQVIDDEQLIVNVSEVLTSIFGFGITREYKSGRNFYSRSWALGDDFGQVCHGGQRNTVFFFLSGKGCAAAALGWERRLYDFLKTAVCAQITRIDIAHDDYEASRFTIDGLHQSFIDGGFNAGGRRPDAERFGNWDYPNGKGRTLSIGNRKNGKSLCCYEKGKQLGDPNSHWVRCELRLGNKDRVIPFDVLLRPSDYLAGSYPVFVTLSCQCSRIETIQKTVQASYTRVLAVTKHQFGGYLNAIMAIEQDASKVLQLVTRETKLPCGLEIPSFATCSQDFIQFQELKAHSIHLFDSDFDYKPLLGGSENAKKGKTKFPILFNELNK